MEPRPTLIVTGISGNLGSRLLPMLSNYHVVGLDIHSPASHSHPDFEFEKFDLSLESSCLRLTELLNETGARAVVHLAFVIDPQRTGILDAQRMWQINVAGTARVMEAIAVHNRLGGNVQTLIAPSSVSAYGPELPPFVKEDYT